MILLTKSPRKPIKDSRKPPGSYKKFQGRNPYNIFVAILVEMMSPKNNSKLTLLKTKLKELTPCFEEFIVVDRFYNAMQRLAKGIA